MIFNALLLLLLLITVAILVVQLLLIHSTLKYGIPPIPTTNERIQVMLQRAYLRSGQAIYDLGCGDGRILRAVSARFKAHHASAQLIGLEINPCMALWAQWRSKLSRPPIHILRKDFFTLDLSQADVIFCYLWPSIMTDIYEKIWPHLPKGCQLISHSFPLPIKEKEKAEVGPNIWVYKYVK